MSLRTPPNCDPGQLDSTRTRQQPMSRSGYPAHLPTPWCGDADDGPGVRGAACMRTTTTTTAGVGPIWPGTASRSESRREGSRAGIRRLMPTRRCITHDHRGGGGRSGLVGLGSRRAACDPAGRAVGADFTKNRHGESRRALPTSCSANRSRSRSAASTPPAPPGSLRSSCLARHAPGRPPTPMLVRHPAAALHRARVGRSPRRIPSRPLP